MYVVVFRSKAREDIKKLPKDVQRRIIQKLEYFACNKTPMVFAKPLRSIGAYRFRVGDYRIIFDLSEHEIIIVSVGHRRDIYR